MRRVVRVLGGTLSMGDDHYTQIGAVALWRVKNGKLVKLAMPKYGDGASHIN